jgi:DNA polymerase-3 subunit epsilon
MFAPAVAFVDLETTGTRAAVDRITEIGVVRVDTDHGGTSTINEWSTLVDPEVPIPPAIQALTGITDAMVARAPTFSTIVRDLTSLLDGCVFVAHNARFDLGFLKHACARLERSFSPRVLCTAKLSRRLYPDAEAHNLDALIARHELTVRERHRALADARAIFDFVQRLYRELPAESIELAVKRILRIPSLPPQLAPDAIERLPQVPGVYLFYGDNPLPLYIGKSINLRERVGSHFSSDWRSETDLRLSQEIRRIEYEETAGELGALLRESMLIKAKMPAHNRALRRKAEAGVLVLDGDEPSFVPAHTIDRELLAQAYGPFTSRASARAMLREAASRNGLCWRRLGLDRRTDGPCFARQLKRCRGACIGEESVETHAARVALALLPLAIPRWPHDGAAVIREASPDGGRVDAHVVRDWCWLGTARDDGELAQLAEAPMRSEFDPDVTRLLLKRYAARTLALIPILRTATVAFES